MKFEWDSAKAAANQRKHGVPFEDATEVFLDPHRVESYDGREAYGEDRWKTVGVVVPNLLCVVYTLRKADGELVRLISARKADKHERANYREIHT